MEEAAHGEDDNTGCHAEHHRRCKQIWPDYPHSVSLAVCGAGALLLISTGLRIRRYPI
jgi:hypothetical protein